MIDLHLLVDEGFLTSAEIENIPRFQKRKVEFDKVRTWKHGLFMEAFERFQNDKIHHFGDEYNYFLNEHGWWLHDYALFMAAKEHFGKTSWHNWANDFKLRKKAALNKIGLQLEKEVNYHRFLQFLFFTISARLILPLWRKLEPMRSGHYFISGDLEKR